MKKSIVIALFLLAYQGLSGQTLKPAPWQVHPYTGSCYFDTIIQAAWLRIYTGQSAYYLDGDSNYLVLKAELVNKTAVPLYFRGKDRRLRASAVQLHYDLDTALINDPGFMTRDRMMTMGALPRKWYPHVRTVFNREARPAFSDLYDPKNEKSFIVVPPGERKEVWLAFPKEWSYYKAEFVIDFNEEGYAYDCEGNQVTWEAFRTFASNWIELRQ